MILSALFDRGGALRALRLVTDPRAGAHERRMAHLLRLAVFNRYGARRVELHGLGFGRRGNAGRSGPLLQSRRKSLSYQLRLDWRSRATVRSSPKSALCCFEQPWRRAPHCGRLPRLMNW